ncbi:hypothetical protein L7F22_018105 [Adiantum nelumboides]|nr:hypothetical protein [Adiantum nelumboides]
MPHPSRFPGIVIMLMPEGYAMDVRRGDPQTWKISHAEIPQEFTRELHRMQEDIYHLRGAVREEGELPHMDELKEGLKKEYIAELKEDMIQELDTKQGNWIEVVKKNIKKEVREERAKEEVARVQDTLKEEKLRHARRLNVRITGLPEGASPDTDAQEFCRSLGYTTMPFTRVWRAGKDATRSRALILQMQSQEDRVAFFRKRHSLFGASNDIDSHQNRASRIKDALCSSKLSPDSGNFLCLFSFL